MEIIDGIEIVDLGLFIKKERTLVISDLHIGYEEALNKEGMLIPRNHFSEMMKRLERIMKMTKPEMVIINGDLKHEFGTISEQEWRDALKLIDFATKSAKLVLVRGNHDKILGPIAGKRGIEIVDFLAKGNVMILHGDKHIEIGKDIKTLVIGHQHPALSIGDSIRKESFKCFLSGKYKSKNLIVMPSFSNIAQGTDVTKEKPMVKYIKNFSGFSVYVVHGNEIRKFERL